MRYVISAEVRLGRLVARLSRYRSESNNESPNRQPPSMKKTPSRTQLPDQRDGQAPATRRLAAVLCLSLLLSGCAHGAVARTGGPPGAEAVRDVKRCPDDGEQVELPAHSVFHLPTDAVRKAWREALGSDAEGGAIEELAVHLGAPPAEMVAAKWDRLRKNPKRESATQLLADTTVAIMVCDDEVAAVMKKLQAAEDADTERYRDLTASLLGVAGGLQYLSEANWHAAVHILESIDFADRIKKMFESADSEIDTIENNL